MGINVSLQSPDLDAEYKETREAVNDPNVVYEELRHEVQEQPPEEPDTNLTVENDSEGLFGTALDMAVQGGVGVLRGVDQMAATIDRLVPDEGINEFLTGNPEGIQFDLPEAKTTAGAMTGGITQFATGFVPFARGLKALGTGKMMTSYLAGGAADFAAFDPLEERLSNLIQDTPLANPVTGFLEAKEDDGEFEGRIKQVLEGFGLGAIADGFMRGLRGLREIRRNRNAVKAADAAEAGDAVRKADEEAKYQQRIKTDTRVVPDAPNLRPEDTESFLQKLEEARVADAESGVKYFDKKRLASAWADFNYKNLSSEQEVRDVLDVTSEKLALDKTPVSNRTVSELAEEIGTSEEALRSVYASTDNLAARVTAARGMLNGSAKYLKELADISVDNPTSANLMAFRRHMVAHSMIQAQVKGVQTNVARALQSMRINADDLAIDVADKLDTMGGTDAALKMAKHVRDLASDQKKLNAYARKSVYRKSVDSLREIHVNLLLSNMGTQAINMTGNAYMIAQSMAERAVAAGVSQTIGSGEIGFRELGEQLFAMRKAIPEAARLAVRAAKLGEPIMDAQTKMEYHVNALSAEAFNATGVAGKLVDWFGGMIRIPGRGLQGGDEFFKVMNYRMENAALAARQAKREGLTGAEAGRRIQELLAEPLDDVKMDPQAIKLKRESMLWAREQTFQEQLGDTGRFVESALETDAGKLARFVIPFFRTPTNIVKQVNRRVFPTSLLSQRVRADLAAGGATRDLAAAKMATGTGLMWYGYSLAQEGVITGSGPSDPNERAQWFEAGWRPYAIFKGGEFVQYNRLDPVGMWLGLAADGAEYMNQLDETNEELGPEIVSAGVLSLYENLKNKVWLQSVAELMVAIEDEDNPERLNTFLERIGASIVVPAGLASTNEALENVGLNFADVDPHVRDAWNFYDEVRKRIPGLSQELPPKRDVFGEPITKGGAFGPNGISPIYKSEITDDPVRKEIARLQMGIEKPPKRIGNVDLTHEQYDRYAELAGKSKVRNRTLHENIERLMQSPRYKNGTDGDPTQNVKGTREKDIKALISAHRTAARVQLAAEYPELQEAVLMREMLENRAMKEPIADKPLENIFDG